MLTSNQLCPSKCICVCLPGDRHDEGLMHLYLLHPTEVLMQRRDAGNVRAQQYSQICRLHLDVFI